ncbi:MAG TPA: hypothetical protein VH092_27115 [Urbifossiella sp.]|jgi:hypothetical protein|nr:hypothetical protein [Urbifossiella sp.]
MLLFIDDVIRGLRREGLQEIFCFGSVLGFILWVGLLAALSRLLGRVAPENRRMEPGEVWVNLIPVVNLVWAVVTVERVGESVRAELKARGLAKKRDAYGKTAGIIALVLIAVVLLLPPAGVVTLPFALIYAVGYWVQMNGYARRMREEPVAPEPVDEGW